MIDYQLSFQSCNLLDILIIDVYIFCQSITNLFSEWAELHSIWLCATEQVLYSIQSLEVVSRYRDPQPQVTENVCYLRNLSPNIIYISVSRLKAYFTFNNWLSGVTQVLIKTQNVYCSRHQCSKGLSLVAKYCISNF